GDAGKAQNIDLQHLSRSPRGFEIYAAVVAKTEVKIFAGGRLLDHLGVTFELIADCCFNEIGAVRVEPFLHHEINVTQIDIAEIDGNFFGVRGLWSEFVDIVGHLGTSPFSSYWMVYGGCSAGF